MIEAVYVQVIKSEEKCCIGQKEPLAHPCNCRTECPFGYGKAYCFPCLAKIIHDYKGPDAGKED